MRERLAEGKPGMKPDYLGRRATYTQEQMSEAEAQWEDFSGEWEPFRKRAHQSGILYPPSGTKWDQWDDDNPSQRAVLIRAIRETPQLLTWAISGAKAPTWSAVIERLFSGRDEMRTQIPKPEPSLDPTPSQASYRLGEILTILRDSK